MSDPGKPSGDGECDARPVELKDDLLRGAAEIAEFLFGDAGKRRTVFHLVATTRIPVFRLGSMICARRATLLAWIADQECRVPRHIGGHQSRKKGKPDEPTPTPACPPPRPRGPVLNGAALTVVPKEVLTIE